MIAVSIFASRIIVSAWKQKHAEQLPSIQAPPLTERARIDSKASSMITLDVSSRTKPGKIIRGHEKLPPPMGYGDLDLF